MHALPFLQGSIGNLDGREQIAWLELEGLETHDDRRARHAGRALQRYCTQRQGARDSAQDGIDEERADVVLAAQKLNNLTCHGAVVVGDIDEVGAATGGDDDLRVDVVLHVASAAKQSIASQRMLAGPRSGLFRWIDGLITRRATHIDLAIRVE